MFAVSADAFSVKLLLWAQLVVPVRLRVLADLIRKTATTVSKRVEIGSTGADHAAI